MSKEKKPRYFHGDQWYNKQMDQRTRQALGLSNTQPLRGAGQKAAYKEEYKRQAKLWRQERAAKKISKALARTQRAKAKK